MSSGDYDAKQQKLIDTWINHSCQSTDVYVRFISLWIAFNAQCYARFSRFAQCNRADLKKDVDLNGISEDGTSTSAQLTRTGSTLKITLATPVPIAITISEKYSEDRIFTEFAKQYKCEYKKILDEKDFASALQEFVASLCKGNSRHFVLNMLKADEYDEAIHDSFRGGNIYVALDKPSCLRQLKDVLYQVRCNIFHGEKVPGEVNDDKIAKAAIPVLERLVEMLKHSPAITKVES